MLLAQIATISAGVTLLIMIATYLTELDGYGTKEIRITRYISFGIFAASVLTAAISASVSGIKFFL
jgi:hypothetical protein